MAGSCFTLFDTAIGRCGIVWGERGIAGVQLPEERDSETRARLRRRFPETREVPPARDVKRAIDAIVALLDGQAVDLGALALDMEAVPEFHRRVYDVARTIPRGATLTYGEIARRLDEPGSARAVGQALGKNPFAIVVPCHRVLAAGGKPGGFSATGGAKTKLRMLAIEGAAVARRGADALRQRERARLRREGGARPRARGRRGARARDRRGRSVSHGAQGDDERVRRAGRSDRLPAAPRKSGGDDLRPALRLVSARGLGSDAAAHPGLVRRGAALRRPLAREVARAARPGGARQEPQPAHAHRHRLDGRRGRSSTRSRRCAASAAGPRRCS